MKWAIRCLWACALSGLCTTAALSQPCQHDGWHAFAQDEFTLYACDDTGTALPSTSAIIVRDAASSDFQADLIPASGNAADLRVSSVLGNVQSQLAGNALHLTVTSVNAAMPLVVLDISKSDVPEYHRYVAAIAVPGAALQNFDTLASGHAAHFLFAQGAGAFALQIDPATQAISLSAEQNTAARLGIAGQYNPATGSLTAQLIDSVDQSALATLSFTTNGVDGTVTNTGTLALGALTLKLAGGHFSIRRNANAYQTQLTVQAQPMLPAIFGSVLDTKPMAIAFDAAGMHVNCTQDLGFSPIARQPGFAVPAGFMAGLRLAVSSVLLHCGSAGFDGVTLGTVWTIPGVHAPVNAVMSYANGNVHVTGSPVVLAANVSGSGFGLNADIRNLTLGNAPADPAFAAAPIALYGDVELGLKQFPAVHSLQSTYALVPQADAAGRVAIDLLCKPQADPVQPGQFVIAADCSNGHIDGIKNDNSQTLALTDPAGAVHSFEIGKFKFTSTPATDVVPDVTYTSSAAPIKLGGFAVSKVSGKLLDGFATTNEHDLALSLDATMTLPAFFDSGTVSVRGLQLPLSTTSKFTAGTISSQGLSIAGLTLRKEVSSDGTRCGAADAITWDSAVDRLRVCGYLDLPKYLHGESKSISLSSSDLRTASLTVTDDSSDVKSIFLNLAFGANGLQKNPQVDVSKAFGDCTKHFDDDALRLGPIWICANTAALVHLQPGTALTTDSASFCPKVSQSAPEDDSQPVAVLMCATIKFKRYVSSNDQTAKIMSLFDRDGFVAAASFDQDLTLSYAGETLGVSGLSLSFTQSQRDIEATGYVTSKQLDYSTFYFRTVGVRQVYDQSSNRWQLPKPHLDPDWGRTAESFGSRVTFDGLSALLINLLKHAIK